MAVLKDIAGYGSKCLWNWALVNKTLKILLAQCKCNVSRLSYVNRIYY